MDLMPEFRFDRVSDPAALSARWRKLEAASQGGFFRGWTYLGTLLPHFTDPHLLSVREGGEDRALGLFNRAGGLFHLHETGDRRWDRLYVEHNGLLIRPGDADLVTPALAFCLQQGSLSLSGVDDRHARAAAASGEAHGRFEHFAPAIDLGALARSGVDILDTISGNARSQIRRAMRLYGSALSIEPARTLAQAQQYFDRLAALHQQSWIARGHEGAFADPAIRHFHKVLIEAGLPRGEVHLLRVCAGEQELGLLYLFRHGGRVLSYQSGFVQDVDPRRKPGLICHTLAIRLARDEGASVYDFLAGAQRYKTTLAPSGGETLHWLTVHRRGSPGARWARLNRVVGQTRRALRSAPGR